MGFFFSYESKPNLSEQMVGEIKSGIYTNYYQLTKPSTKIVLKGVMGHCVPITGIFV